jgi:hypothetical protein
MPRRSTVRAVTTIGIDMGKNTLHMGSKLNPMPVTR